MGSARVKSPRVNECGNAREEGGHVPDALILRGKREGEADVNSTEEIDGLPRVFEILRAEGNVSVNFVAGNPLPAPEIEDVEFDGALIGGGVAGNVMAGGGVGGDDLRAGGHEGVAGIGGPALNHVRGGRGGAVGEGVVREHGPGRDFGSPVDGARSGRESEFCWQGSSLP